MLKTNKHTNNKHQLPEHRVWEEGWVRKVRYDVKSENMLFNTMIAGEMTKGVSVGGGERIVMLQ